MLKRYKKLFRVSLAFNIGLLLFWAGKRYYFQHRSPVSTNFQYTEQTGIFPAYSAACRIAIIGDSHIYKAHWDELLNEVICNRGIGSDVTAGMLMRVGDVIKAKPKICFIEGGINDIQRGVGASEIASNIKAISDSLVSNGIANVFINVLPVGKNYNKHEKINQKVKRVNYLISQIGIETILVELSEEDYQPDGLHLRASGYTKLAVAIKSRSAREE